MVFHGWQRTGLTLVQLSQNNELLEGFFPMSELFVLADIDFLVLVCQKSPRGKTRSSSVAVLSRPKLAAVKQFLHLFTRNLFIMDYVGDVVCLPEVFCKFSNTLFASVKSGVRDNEWIRTVEQSYPELTCNSFFVVTRTAL